MIKKIMVFGLFFIFIISCEKDFGVEDTIEDTIKKDVTINTINLGYSGDFYPFVYNNSAYLVGDNSTVYKINEFNNTVDKVRDLYVTYDPIGPMQEINGSLYFATEKYIYKVNNSSFSSCSIVDFPSSSYGEIISFTVINDIAFICFKNGYVFKNTTAFSSSSSFIRVLVGARVIETGGKYYIYSGASIYGSTNASFWSKLTTAKDVVVLSGKDEIYATNSKLTGILSDGEDKLLVSYIYRDSIYTDLLNESFSASVNYTSIPAVVRKPYYNNTFIMGESFLLDGGTFFNFEYQLYSSSSSYYPYPLYSISKYRSSCSASLNLKETGVKAIVNSDLIGCMAPIKLDNKIYAYNKLTKSVVIVSE